jgi:DUF971 family protein
MSSDSQLPLSSRPKEIRRVETADFHGLLLQWTDGASTSVSAEELRRNCPCASCQEQRGDSSHSKPLGGKSSLLRVVSATVEESLRMDSIWGIGNYAIGIRWGDGHETGIYPFSLLRELSQTSSVK